MDGETGRSKRERSGADASNRRGRRSEIVFADIPPLIEGGFSPARGVGEGWVSFDYELEGVHGTGIAAGGLWRPEHRPAAEAFW